MQSGMLTLSTLTPASPGSKHVFTDVSVVIAAIIFTNNANVERRNNPTPDLVYQQCIGVVQIMAIYLQQGLLRNNNKLRNGFTHYFTK